MLPALFVAALASSLSLSAPEHLEVASFNLRYDAPDDPHPWTERRSAVAALMRRADVVGTQEGLYHQVRDLEEALGEGWDWIGLGRDGGSHGEFMAIFFDARRFEPLEFDHFWLSETPETMGSVSWGHTNRRMVTWVRLREREGDLELYVVNTHFDHLVAEARKRSALLLRERIGELDPELPLVVTGDFNAPAETSAPWRILVEEGPLEDAWLEADSREGRVGTFHGWGPPRKDGPRIDWVLVRGVERVRAAAAWVDRPEGVWPSDHLPVWAELELEP